MAVDGTWLEAWQVFCSDFEGACKGSMQGMSLQVHAGR